MHQFEKGGRVVYKGGPGSPVEAGDKGIVEWVSTANPNRICVRTDQGRGF